MADTILTLENINELAQAVTSLGDGDYIYIFKAGASGFSKIEKNVFFQGISSSSSSGTDDEARDRIADLWAKVNELIGDLANLAFRGSKTDQLDDLDWSSSTPVIPSDEPSLTLKSNGSNISSPFNLGQHSGSGTSKTINVKGENLSEDLTVTVEGTGFSADKSTITESAAESGTTLVLTYNGTASGQQSGTLTISSSEVTKQITLKGSYIQQGGGGDPVDPESYQVSAGTLSHVR